MQARVVTTGLAFPEGPLELPGGDILVTEIRAGVLTRVKPDGTRSLFAVTGGGPNGAALGPDGSVFVTQNGGFAWIDRPQPDGSVWKLPGGQPEDYVGGQIQRVSRNGGEVVTLYRECEGVPLSGPNDIVFDAEGNFYFTDIGKSRARERDRGRVCYASPDGKMIREILFPMEGPNGIGLSPDGKVLYVAESPTARLWAVPLDGPGQPAANRYVLATVIGPPPQNLAFLDSLCVDGAGNVLVATILGGGITTVSPDGAHVELTPTGDAFTTNACFAGPGLTTLYATLSGSGQLAAFDDWPTAGLKLHFQE
jgi:gluconolactonase